MKSSPRVVLVAALLTGCPLPLSPCHNNSDCNTSVDMCDTNTGKCITILTTSRDAGVSTSSSGMSSGSSSSTAAEPRLAFTAAPASVEAAACSSIFRVQSLGAAGTPVVSVAGLPVMLTGLPGGLTFFSDAACQNPISSSAIAAGSDTAEFYLQGSVAGPASVSASAAGFTAAVTELMLVPGAPLDFLFATPAQTVTAGTCSGATTLQLVDAVGNAAPALAATEFTLTADPVAGFGAFTDGQCTQPAATASIPAGSSSVDIHFKSTVAADVTVTASTPALGARTQIEFVQAAAASAIVFSTPAVSLPAGNCSPLMTLETRDRYGNVSTIPTARTLALGATPSTGVRFFNAAGCTMPVASVMVPAGGATTGFYFSGSTSGTITLTASAGGLLQAEQPQTVSATFPTQLRLTTPPRSARVNECSQVLRAELADASGNMALTPTALPLSLSTVPASGLALFQDAACTAPLLTPSLAAFTGAFDFYFQGSSVGEYDVAAAATGLSEARQVATVTPGAADRLAFLSGAMTVTRGQCSSAITVQSRSMTGDPAPLPADATVLLTAEPPTGFAFFADATCLFPITSVMIAQGTPSATFHVMGTEMGTVTVQATSAPLLGVSQVATIAMVGLPTNLFVTSPPLTVTAGVCSAELAVVTQDSGGTARAVISTTAINLSASSPSLLFYPAGSGCMGTSVTSVDIPAGMSTAGFVFTETAAGPVDVVLAAAGLSGTTQQQNVTPQAPSALRFVSGNLVVTAGGCSPALTLEAMDSFTNPARPASPLDVSLAANPATGVAFFLDPACNSAMSSVTITATAAQSMFHLRATVAGMVELSAQTAGLGNVIHPISVLAAPPSALVFSSAAQNGVAGICSEVVTVETRDTFGNPSNVAGATLVTLSGPPDVTFFDDGGCTSTTTAVTVAAGMQSAAFHFTGTRAGMGDVTASASGFVDAAQQETITAAPADALVWSGLPSVAAEGRAVSVTLRAEDPYGNTDLAFVTPAALSVNPAVAFTCSAGCNGTATTPLVGGVWSGEVAFSAAASGLRLAAAAGVLTGQSNPFDVARDLGTPPATRRALHRQPRRRGPGQRHHVQRRRRHGPGDRHG